MVLFWIAWASVSATLVGFGDRNPRVAVERDFGGGEWYSGIASSFFAGVRAERGFGECDLATFSDRLCFSVCLRCCFPASWWWWEREWCLLGLRVGLAFL